MEALREVLGDCESADDFGLRGDFIEAEAIGFIAARSVRGLPVTFPKTTGAPRPTAAGKLYKAQTATVARSEERRAGNERGSTCRDGGAAERNTQHKEITTR